MELSVFIFTWNTQTVRYNSDNGPKADFVQALGEKIKTESRHDIIVLGLQEDSIRDSPLLADENSLLVTEIADQYQLVDNLSLSGWGSTTFKALKNNWEYVPRGLRLAVLKRRDLDIDIYNVESKAFVCPGIRNWITCGKGGLAINLDTSVGKLCLLNVHLPFNSKSLFGGKENREPAVIWQADCLQNLYKSTVDKYNPDYLFILGDLNFRVPANNGATVIAEKIFNDTNREYLKELYKTDEFKILRDFEKLSVLLVKEGIDDQGPMFIPTCKMRQRRNSLDSAAFALGTKDQRAPSWCDRILYKSFNDNSIQCVEYDRWEHSTMNLSDHASVFGIFKITC